MTNIVAFQVNCSVFQYTRGVMQTYSKKERWLLMWRKFDQAGQLFSTFRFPLPSCCKFGNMQLVPNEENSSNYLNYRPLALNSCLPQSLESISNRKLFYVYLLTFVSMNSTDDHLAVIIKSQSSSHIGSNETSAATFDISKKYGRVWHKSLLSTYLLFFTFMSQW